MEQRIDDMTDEFRRKQLERMRQGSCSDEACIIFSELLTDLSASATTPSTSPRSGRASRPSLRTRNSES